MEKIKQGFKKHLKTKLPICIVFLGLIGFVLGWLEISKIPYKIEKESFFWFFSATSQSMAALFAVVGMFGVFRYQIVNERLRNLYEVLKQKIVSPDGRRLFGDRGATAWFNSEIFSKANKLLEEKKGKQALHEYQILLQGMEISLREIKDTLGERDTILSVTRLPIFFMLITFLISIGCLPFSGELSNNIYGKFILYFLIVLIAISMGIAFYSIRLSISSKTRK